MLKQVVQQLNKSTTNPQQIEVMDFEHNVRSNLVDSLIYRMESKPE